MDELEKCKHDCADNDDCEAVVLRENVCWFKPSGCKDDLTSVNSGAITYMKLMD